MSRSQRDISVPCNAGGFGYFCPMSTWRERLLDILAERGISMRRLSAMIGKSESYMKHVLKNGAEPSLDAVLKIRDELNIPLSTLIDGVPDDPRVESLARKMAKLTPSQTATVEAVVNSLLETTDKAEDKS